MRKLRSVVALSSAVAVMACQTAVASTSALRDSQVAPVAASQHATQANVLTKSEAPRSTTAVEGTSHKKTWIIVGVVAAIIAVAVVVAASGGSEAVY
jgi:hypothetical protein